jgi:hypothetical protein
MRFLLAAMFLAGALFRASTVFAWADMGHSIVGQVAEDLIEPSTKDFVRGILGVEPLAVAAIFPDHVRDDARFHPDFDNFHFCEIPTGYTYDTRPNKATKDCYGAISQSIAILKDTSPKITREEKILALRYLIHVMGDITQPLHIGNGFDLGGNACAVRWMTPESSPTNLHSVWDDKMVVYLGQSFANPQANPPVFPAVFLNAYMQSLKLRNPQIFTGATKKGLSSANLKDWLQDSATAREGDLYPDDAQKMAGVQANEKYKHRAYCMWYADQDAHTVGTGSAPDMKSLPQAEVPVLGKAYADAHVKIVEEQLLKGGVRLAAVLDEVAASVAKSAPKLDDSQEKSILQDLLGKFMNFVK